MKVLVMEPMHGADPGDGSSDGATVLQAAGYDVVRCFDDTDQGPLCKGMPGGSGCPLEIDGVDVAVARGDVAGSPELVDGVRCVVRHFVPLVTTGALNGAIGPNSQQSNSQQPKSLPGEGLHWFGGVIPMIHADGADALAAAVSAAAGSPLRRHGELATSELRRVLADHDLGAGDALAVVQRINGGLRVELFPKTSISNQIAHAAAVRVAAALRAHDRTANGIGVVLAIGR